MQVNCPTCKKSVEWVTTNEFRPFCSDRCKLIDLGEWASEERSIPGEDVSPQELQPKGYEFD
ncbi:DNA gyrase inhibitor YacG [Moritella sp. Urea-trap-13]|uniref:DNA gyrase inhibitor YacG n=1 Tax=Moritella sp. Urea-trap-13 TaxID=2058327 RepID=UPI000C332D42|nr:DNA gyrase inhibitor YacG [Moritella sp. Urea-trap-13]PKH05086.1 DNA gyrase inhibitor YacG [Moritella sp. Urea-trap-13]